jgi:hypothetical protein
MLTEVEKEEGAGALILIRADLTEHCQMLS